MFTGLCQFPASGTLFDKITQVMPVIEPFGNSNACFHVKQCIQFLGS